MITALKACYRAVITPLEALYLSQRDRLPAHRYIVYSGVRVFDVKALDRMFPKMRRTLDRLFPVKMGTRDIDEYEGALVRALLSTVKTGMTVVIVGGGYGITACVAARLVGSTGSVVCFEGNKENAELVKRTARLNGVETIVQVKEGIVGDDRGVYDGEKSSLMIHPAALPHGDILELDCEGAEINIISHLEIFPQVILVETHGFLGASTSEVSGLLSQKGYRVEDRGPAEPRLASLCEANDIRCLLATLA